jgi:hypothetical protein
VFDLGLSRGIKRVKHGAFLIDTAADCAAAGEQQGRSEERKKCGQFGFHARNDARETLAVAWEIPVFLHRERNDFCRYLVSTASCREGCCQVFDPAASGRRPDLLWIGGGEI